MCHCSLPPADLIPGCWVLHLFGQDQDFGSLCMSLCGCVCMCVCAHVCSALYHLRGELKEMSGMDNSNYVSKL